MEMEEIEHLVKDGILRMGYCPTTVFMYGTDGKTIVMLENFPNGYEEKVAYMDGAGKYARKSCSVGYVRKVFLVMEAWMAKGPINTGYIPPHLHPDRTEIAIIGCLDVQTQEHSARSFEYIRDADGILREIKDYILPDGTRTAQAESPLLPAFVAGYNHITR